MASYVPPLKLLALSCKCVCLVQDQHLQEGSSDAQSQDRMYALVNPLLV